ncbi:MAG: HEAT repeat domain-containing protein [Gemmatimonadetes bacterium]|nr:HEAT repeat domain-containing protein [Gemmatimonadota bacterium]MYE94926.1 HEAT repeat domain-containing protein [Gemmatimonadota bacterium]MYJ12300.1 HEAT repeat domain-containing protein [Gemmatimonadota bacterium]
MPPLALKPDSSFFRKIALGAVGSRHVAHDLERLGHQVVELERGAMDTKLWKDVKRKRVRIPDLVCELCGLRIESRAKTRPDLSMSHSSSDHERAWDFGMVDADVIAFPVCKAGEDEQWSAGRLQESVSYWHERNWIRWHAEGTVNYVRVARFRAVSQDGETTKGVTEGSETSVTWKAWFSSRDGFVESIMGQRITTVRASDGHRYTRTVPEELRITVAPGEEIALNQILASRVKPENDDDLRCPGVWPEGHLSQLLESRERTQRFTGVKLARLRRNDSVGTTVASLERDHEEDMYIRLEAAAYLVAVRGESAEHLFAPYLASPDQQIRLEAVISLGEAGTDECVTMLSAIMDDDQRPYFVRSAAAWSLSRIGGSEASSRLVRAFGDVDQDLREEALEGIVSLDSDAVPALLAGLRETEPAIAAGCAEALRQRGAVSDEAIRELTAQLASSNPSVWAVWLVGHLPRERLAGAVADLQETAPELHYAITLLWSFVESWIARRWELQPEANLPNADDGR